MKCLQKSLCIALALCLLLSGCTHGAFDEADRIEQALAAEMETEPGHLLENEAWFPAGSSAGDWFALTLCRCGEQEDYGAYLRKLEAFVAQSDDDLSATDCARIALTVHTLGGDPVSFGSKDLLAAGYARYEQDGMLNAAVYLLLAMDAYGYADDTKRQSLCKTLVSAQEPDGGFGFVRGGSDADMTAMTLQALAPYRADCPDTIETALHYLANTVTADGMYASMGTPNAESTAQVLLALCALGIDPLRDARFAAVPDGLLCFRMDNGLYRHTLGDLHYNLLATQQALLARYALNTM